MRLSGTPNSRHPARATYERAFFDDDKSTLRAIELDTLIDNSRSAIASDQFTVEQKMQLMEKAQTNATNIVYDELRTDTSSFVALSRIVGNELLLTEKILLPLYFGNNTRQAKLLRQKLINGTAGKYTDTIDLLYKAEEQGIATKRDRDYFVGAVQENTIAALLGRAESSDFAVLQSSYYQDRKEGTDLLAYFMAEDGHGYVAPISVKTSRRSAERDRSAHSDTIVLCGEDIGNRHLELSKLLVAENEGHPGISDYDKIRLDSAHHTLYEQFCHQLAIPGTRYQRVDHQPLQRIRQLPLQAA